MDPRPHEAAHLPDGSVCAANLVLELGYQGTDFSGFAEQEGNIRTVAGELKRALQTLLHREVDLVCAGRTDAGVHALGQVVSVAINSEELTRSGSQLMRALNALCPDDISIRKIYQAAPDFSARFSALTRSYRYRIYEGEARPVFTYDFAWWIRTHLDVDAMHKAAQALVGEHDFASFAKSSSLEGKSSVRELESISVTHISDFSEELVAVDVCGSAFLHNMVRNIVGSLVEVGRGKKESHWIAEVLEAHDRKAAGTCAPAKGLCFIGVNYEVNIIKRWE